MFPGPRWRWCTSDFKRGPIEREIRRFLKAHPRFGGRIVNCMGMRAEESSDRAHLVPWKRNQQNSKAGRAWYDWLPIHAFSTDDVFHVIEQAGQQPHWAYAEGVSRVSCIFCLFGTEENFQIGARLYPICTAAMSTPSAAPATPSPRRDAPSRHHRHPGLIRRSKPRAHSVKPSGATDPSNQETAMTSSTSSTTATPTARTAPRILPRDASPTRTKSRPPFSRTASPTSTRRSTVTSAPDFSPRPSAPEASNTSSTAFATSTPNSDNADSLSQWATHYSNEIERHPDVDLLIRDGFHAFYINLDDHDRQQALMNHLRDCARPGDAEPAVRYVLDTYRVVASPDIRDELKRAGYDPETLDYHERNVLRFVWYLGHQIRDNPDWFPLED